MDREGVEQRFRERVAEFRKDYVRFLAGAIVVSVAIAVGAGVVFYMVATYLWIFVSSELPPRGAIVTAYIVLSGVIGYAQYRRRPGATDDEDGIGFVVLRDLNLLYVLLSFPSLIFQFAHEIVAGRHIFGTPEVERLAFEVFYDGGEKPSPEFLQAKLAEHPTALRRALQLLVEMRFLMFHRHGRERTLLRSLTGAEFLEESG